MRVPLLDHATAHPLYVPLVQRHRLRGLLLLLHRRPTLGLDGEQLAFPLSLFGSVQPRGREDSERFGQPAQVRAETEVAVQQSARKQSARLHSITTYCARPLFEN